MSNEMMIRSGMCGKGKTLHLTVGYMPLKLEFMIRTIKDLKEIIQTLPDDMEVMGYNGDLVCISHWVISEKTLTEEEIRHGYPNGVIPTLVISTD